VSLNECWTVGSSTVTSSYNSTVAGLRCNRPTWFRPVRAAASCHIANDLSAP